MAKNLRFYTLAGLLVIAAAAGAGWLLTRSESDAATQATDDAYVQADFTVIAPQVSATIAKVDVLEHQAVRAGQPLLHLDDRALRIAVDAAKAHVASADAAVNGLQAQIERQGSALRQAKAALSADDASLSLAEANRQRFSNLARDGSGSVQAQQQADSQWQVQQAARERDLAGVQSTEQQTTILKADLERLKAAVLSARAEQAAAELNLSYAQIQAPTNAVVAEQSARVGGYVHAGQALLTLVPADGLYVEANFRETQMAHMRVGQPVSLNIDALPGVQLKGEVESLAPASGASLSPLPAHNATGNFTKIVQRLPVRIRLLPGQAALPQLRVGMSVHPQIDVSAAH